MTLSLIFAEGHRCLTAAILQDPQLPRYDEFSAVSQVMVFSLPPDIEILTDAQQ